MASDVLPEEATQDFMDRHESDVVKRRSALRVGRRFLPGGRARSEERRLLSRGKGLEDLVRGGKARLTYQGVPEGANVSVTHTVNGKSYTLRQGDPNVGSFHVFHPDGTYTTHITPGEAQLVIERTKGAQQFIGHDSEDGYRFVKKASSRSASATDLSDIERISAAADAAKPAKPGDVRSKQITDAINKLSELGRPKRNK